MKSRWEQLGIPNPGSVDALNRGCRCPEMDNVCGRGFPLDGELCFVINMDCPLHVPLLAT